MKKVSIHIATLTFFSIFLSLCWVKTTLAVASSSTDSAPSSQTNVIPVLKSNDTAQAGAQTTTTQTSTQVTGLPASSPPIIINVQMPNTEKPIPAPSAAVEPAPALPAPVAEASAVPPSETTGASRNFTITNLKADAVKSKLRKGEIVVQIPPTPSIKLIIDKRFVNAPEIKKLYDLLGAASTNRRIHFVDNRLLAEANPYDNIIYLQPRSFLDVLNYLSDAVDVPEALVKSGVVPSPKYPDGRIFDLKQMTSGIINIYRSKHKPTSNVNVAVYYRNHWFYLKDNDVSSKRTFLLAQQLFHLQSGEIGKTSPILTIPVR